MRQSEIERRINAGMAGMWKVIEANSPFNIEVSKSDFIEFKISKSVLLADFDSGYVSIVWRNKRDESIWTSGTYATRAIGNRIMITVAWNEIWYQYYTGDDISHQVSVKREWTWKTFKVTRK